MPRIVLGRFLFGNLIPWAQIKDFFEECAEIVDKIDGYLTIETVDNASENNGNENGNNETLSKFDLLIETLNKAVELASGLKFDTTALNNYIETIQAKNANRNAKVTKKAKNA